MVSLLRASAITATNRSAMLGVRTSRRSQLLTIGASDRKIGQQDTASEDLPDRVGETEGAARSSVRCLKI
jgi:hypothetical protein